MLKYLLKVDTFLQGVLILFGLGLLFASLFNASSLTYAFFCFLGLGLTQVLSGLFYAMFYKNEKRQLFLSYIFAFILSSPLVILLMVGIVSSIYTIIDIPIGIFYLLILIYGIGIPLFFAFRYFKMTIRDMTKVNTLHRSFWDI